eukprot:GEZU01043006.1.p1 GENE.GEZU01043006.1~~GEZU01043006.1.p1  ORF type:complete len:106 (-),score=34.46 GEZU01043006.1:303-620(-)
MGHGHFFTQTQKVLGIGSMVLFSGMAIFCGMGSYYTLKENREAAKKWANRGYTINEEGLPTLIGGFGNPKHIAQRYKEAVARGEKPISWEVDYMAYKDSQLEQRN